MSFCLWAGRKQIVHFNGFLYPPGTLKEIFPSPEICETSSQCFFFGEERV